MFVESNVTNGHTEWYEEVRSKAGADLFLDKIVASFYNVASSDSRARWWQSNLGWYFSHIRNTSSVIGKSFFSRQKAF